MFAFKEGTHHENVIVQIAVNTGCNKYLELGIYDGLYIYNLDITIIYHFQEGE